MTKYTNKMKRIFSAKNFIFVNLEFLLVSLEGTIITKNRSVNKNTLKNSHKKLSYYPGLSTKYKITARAKLEIEYENFIE